jgi:hypothetical protein
MHGQSKTMWTLPKKRSGSIFSEIPPSRYSVIYDANFPVRSQTEISHMPPNVLTVMSERRNRKHILHLNKHSFC